MFALIRKDLIACRLFLIIGLAIYVLYAMAAFQQPLIFFIMNIGATILLVLMPIVVDDKFRIDTLVCYLPPSRRTVVMARYVNALIALLGGLGLQYGFGAILSVYFEKQGFWTLCAPQAVFAFCIVPVALVSLYLPCFFRLGLGRGTFVFAILIAVLTILMSSPFFASGLLSGKGGFELTPELVQHPEMAFVALIDHIAASVGSARFYTITALSTVALVAVSVFVSIRFFQQRDF